MVAGNKKCLILWNNQTVQWLNTLEFPRKLNFKCSLVLLFSCIQLCATPWTAACQVSLSFTISQSLCKLTSVELVMLSNHLSSCPQSFPASGYFPISQLFTSDSQSIGASASVLPVNIQGWFPLGLTGLISLQSKGFSSLLQHHSLKASIILLCCPSTKTPVWGVVTFSLAQKIALYVHPTRKGIISPPVSFALPIPGVWETQLFFFFFKMFIYLFLLGICSYQGLNPCILHWQVNSWPLSHLGFPGGSNGKESACNLGHLGSIPRLGRSPGGGHGNPLQYSCLENPHGQRSLEGYSPWGRKELDRTERLSTAQSHLEALSLLFRKTPVSSASLSHHTSSFFLSVVHTHAPGP